MLLLFFVRGNTTRYHQSSVKETDCISAEGSDHPNKCPRYDIKQSDGVAPVMLELWGMQSTPSMLLVPAPLWPGVVALGRALSVGQIELFDKLSENK